VQSVFPLGPGLGALKVTTALFFRPGGHSTQHTGVDADVVLPSPFATDQFGERNQPYSLPGRSVEPFLGAGAHGTPPRFTPVTPEILSALQARSAARVGDSEAFQTIVSDLEKREEDDGVIALEELFDDEQSPEKGSENGDGSEESTESEVVSEDQPRTPQLDEALRVLADLVVLQS
jgi:carboxyl-terminal processing protease